MAKSEESPVAVMIRTAGIDDAPALAAIGAALFEQTYAGLIPPAEIAAHVAADFAEAIQRSELADSSVTSLIVEEGDTTVGFAQVRLRDLPVPSTYGASVELWRIYLDRRCHGRGIAHDLMVAVGSAAVALSDGAIWLSVWESNPRAISFYGRYGFEEVGRQGFHVGDEVHSDIVMSAPAGALRPSVLSSR